MNKKVVIFLLVVIFISFASAGTGIDLNASSNNYFLKSFSMGVQASWGTWINSFSTFMGFTDGNSRNAESTSYTANVGVLNGEGSYTQCFPQTCSSLGYNCGTWDDGCGSNLNCGTCGSNYTCNVGVCTLDSDGDSVPDVNDTLIGSGIGDVNYEGFSNPILKINSSSNISGSYSGVQTIEIYDGSEIVLNFSHNFSAGKIYLNQINLKKGTNYLITNLSNQLLSGESKNLSINDNDFVSLCVKNAEVNLVSEVSSYCNGTAEYNFTGCLGNSTGYTNGTMTCYDSGSVISVDNLTHSAIVGTVSTASTAENVIGTAGACIPDPNFDWACSNWGDCTNGVQTRTCLELNNCGNDWGRPEVQRDCLATGSIVPSRNQTGPNSTNVSTGRIGPTGFAIFSGVFPALGPTMSSIVSFFIIIILFSGIYVLFRRYFLRKKLNSPRTIYLKKQNRFVKI